MALNGNFSKLRLGDLLQTLTQNQTWGVLRLQWGGERRDLVVSPFGVAVLDLTNVARSRVEDRLVNRGVLDTAALTSLRSRENAKKPLTELLKGYPAVDPDTMRSVLEAEAAEEVQRLLEWTDGTFELLEGDAPADLLGGVEPRDASALVFEAARRQDEIASFGPRYPDPEEHFVAVPGADMSTLTDDERRVVEVLTDDASLRVAADRTTGDLFSTAKLALTLEDRGILRRLDWRELVELVNAWTAAGNVNAAAATLGFLERWPSIIDWSPLVEIAEHRKAIGDGDGAARCYAKAAEFHVKASEPSSAAECLAKAVALAPQNVKYRELRVEAVRAVPGDHANALYESLRDWLLVCADRGDQSKAELLERELLTTLPPVADEEARIGRALGQLNRRTAAAQLLCRAAKRRLKKRGQEKLAASEFHEALRYVNDYHEARKGLTRLEGRKSGQRRAGVVMLVALIGLASAVAFPVRRSFIEREQNEQLSHVIKMIDQGNIEGATAFLDENESRITSSSLLERCQELRDTIRKKSDERRRLEQMQADAWARKKFADAADAMDAKDYARAAALYAELLDKGADEERVKLVSQRLAMIERKLMYEQRRVEDLCRSLSSKTKTALKTAVLNTQSALAELETLVSERRRDELESFLSKLPASSLQRALEPEELTRLSDALRTATAVFARGLDLRQTLAKKRAEAEELDELDGFLLAARKAESDGDAAAALGAFELLSSRYTGTGLRSYIDDRVKFWKSVKGELTGQASALARGDVEAARAHGAKAKLLCPNVKIGSLDATFELDTVPTGAKLLVDGNPVGTCPVKITVPLGASVRIEARLDGFESLACTGDELKSGKTVFPLVPKPAWTVDLGSPASGQGLDTPSGWILADRRGGVRCIGPGGEIRWSHAHTTLSGIAGNPVLAGGFVYVVTMEGSVAAYTEASGTASTRFDLPTGVRSGPAAAGNAVAFLGSNDVVYVIEAGTTAWRSLTLQGRASTDLTSAGDAWFVGMADGSVVCIEADGSLRWRSFAAPPVDAVRATASGACVVLAGPRLIRLDKQTGVPTHRHELAGLPLLPLLDEAADDGLRLWIVCGKEARSVDLETLDIGKTLPFDVANPRQFAHLPRGFAIATPSGVTVLDAKGRPWWSLTSDRKPFVHASNGAWIGVLDDRGRVYAFSSLP